MLESADAILLSAARIFSTLLAEGHIKDGKDAAKATKWSVEMARKMASLSLADAESFGGETPFPW